jgi:hypothetical protein
MSPTNIEATVRNASPIIGQVCCIGDARPFNTALIVLDPVVAGAVAADAGHDGLGLGEIVALPAVRAVVGPLSRPQITGSLESSRSSGFAFWAMNGLLTAASSRRQ